MPQLPKVARADRIDPDLKSIFASKPIVAAPVVPKALKIVLVWLIGLTLLFAMAPDVRLTEAFSIAIFLMLIGGVVYQLVNREQRKREIEKQKTAQMLFDFDLEMTAQKQGLADLDRAITDHEPALRRNLAAAIKRNDYGAIIADTRLAVATEFMESVSSRIGDITFPPLIVLERIEARISVEAQSQRARGFDPRDIPLDPVLFEHWVADQFTANGWDAEVTQGSGDQGIDVIARKAGNSVGIQCKLYSSNVGNAAVQQALAGIGYYGLTTAAVVSNAGFTASAKALAATTGVRLLSHYDLADPDRALGL